MKSNINWNNYIMRKYGGSIREQIAVVAIKTILNSCKLKPPTQQPPVFYSPGKTGKC